MSGTAADPLTIEARFSGSLGDFQLDVDLSIPAQGVTALTGPSGAGKTSVLRGLAGLVQWPGRLSVCGELWQGQGVFLPAHRRAVGYVFQEASLLAHLSVRKNLTFGLRRAKGARRINFDDIVALLALAPMLERSTGRLSGGERQRVAIGRALLSQPRLLLMDEPLSGLDPQSKVEILTYIQKVRHDLSIPMIYVSHDLTEVARLADRVLEMEAGRIVAPAKPQAGMTIPSEPVGGRLLERSPAEHGGFEGGADAEVTKAARASASVVRRVLRRSGLSVADFANTYCIALDRLSALEQGRAEADSALLAYLSVIDGDPDAVQKALGVPDALLG